MSSFLSFAELCQRVEGVSGSLEKIDLVAAFLKNLDDDELAVASGFIMGDLFSPSMDLVMGVGPSILYEAMARACGCSTERISDMLRATGDPGLVASAAVDKKKPIGFAAFIKDEPLSIKEVYQRLVAVARASGKGSQDAKVKNLQYLFSQATPLEAQYIARLAIEDMRIGIGEGGVRDAIAQAFSQDASKVERAYNLTNDIGLVAVNARKGTLADLSVLINHPIKMMLAQVGEGISASMQELGSAAIEWKYDGARVQIHKDGKRVRIFSRRLEDVTRSLPEIVRLAQEVRADKAILDGEVVAIGKDSRPLAFQEILKRFRRKYNVEKQAKETPLHLFLFDLIYLDGQSTVDLPLTRRRELLEGIADPSILADQVISDSVQRAEEIYHQALEKGHEGLILKNSMSVYAPGKRGKNWLKIKPVMETLDLAVIGAKWGEGRRASFLGSYRLACLDEATSKLQDIGWVATGLTDEALAELTELFRELILVQNGMEVELKPAVIFEVAYEEIQKSQSYSSGYALRFPRLVRVRDDKSLEEADSLERVESLYRVQRGRNNSR
ncbi:ATP-dependent DNA ligase [Methanothrix sp.]|jgi:DNA ligase-1|uniref:ATP-dependent DNA ligase n=1 Tax=Methanothrix sp. TaxID=90426 RepID=UPI001E76995D|nr:ATP-dependent DNA ligase [Methanothrix sp.]UEC40583.1 MAG: DNA ligase [Methanothrix sp.]